MAAAPLVGAALGLVLGATLLGFRALHAPPVLAGALVVGLGALLTRGLHLDGLADTADALGSYRSPERALEIMRRPDVGAFGVIALVLVLLTQAVAVGTVPVPAVATAIVTGRLAITWACRRGVPAARPDGLGALVAGSVAWPIPALTAAVLAALAVPLVASRPWQGPAAIVAAVAASHLLVSHAVRRFGGITGDVLGAAAETATTVALVVLALG